MQQAAEAPVDPKTTFVVNWAEDPWSVRSPSVWRPMAGGVDKTISMAIHAMVQPGYTGQDTVLIPLPLFVGNPRDVPLSFFVAISRRGTGSIWINQFRAATQGYPFTPVSRTRLIRAPDIIVDRYPGTEFYQSNISDSTLCRLFFGAMGDVWRAACDRIRRGGPQVLSAGPCSVFDGARAVLEAEIMQAQPGVASLLFPVGDKGIVAFTRAADTTVNTVQIITSDYGVGEILQGEWDMADKLRKEFPGWSFPYVRLTERELFDLVQLPVRTFFHQTIRANLGLPCLRTLALAFHSKSIANGCRLGTVSRDVMNRIVAFLKLGFQ